MGLTVIRQNPIIHYRDICSLSTAAHFGRQYQGADGNDEVVNAFASAACRQYAPNTAYCVNTLIGHLHDSFHAPAQQGQRLLTRWISRKLMPGWDTINTIVTIIHYPAHWAVLELDVTSASAYYYDSLPGNDGSDRATKWAAAIALALQSATPAEQTRCCMRQWENWKGPPTVVDTPHQSAHDRTCAVRCALHVAYIMQQAPSQRPLGIGLTAELLGPGQESSMREFMAKCVIDNEVPRIWGAASEETTPLTPTSPVSRPASHPSDPPTPESLPPSPQSQDPQRQASNGMGCKGQKRVRFSTQQDEGESEQTRKRAREAHDGGLTTSNAPEALKKFLARPEGSTANPTNKTRRTILPNELERAIEAAKRAEDGRQRKRAATEEAAARKTKAAKTEAATAGDDTSDGTAANTSSRADDQERDTTAKNDDGQVAAPTEHDVEGDVAMGSTGSPADDQVRGEVEENDDGQAAAPTERDGEGDVEMESTGSWADDQERGAAGAEHNDGEKDDEVAPMAKKKHKKKRGKGRKTQTIRRRNNGAGDV